MNHFSLNKKFRTIAATVTVIAITASSFSGCSSEALQKQLQTLSNASSGIASRIASSVGASSKAVSSAAASLAASSKTAGSAANTRVSSKTAVKAQKKSSAPVVPKKTDIKSVKKITDTSSASSAPKKSVAAAQVSATKYTETNQRVDYQHLTSQAEKNIYSLIGRSVYQVAVQRSASGYYPMAQIAISGEVSEAQLRVALLAYMDDHPQVFWLAGVYGYGSDNGRTVLQLYSVYSSDECSAAVKKLDAAVSSVIASMPSGLNEFDREEYLFNYIVNNCSYDNAAVTDTSRWQAFTSYGVLIDGSAVCEGYSRAMQLLSIYAGLNCDLVRGSSDGVGHMWNSVEIDGAWYNLDLTWCDNTIVIYNYFNITDSILGQTHSIGPLVSALSEEQIDAGAIQYNIYLNICDATKANYFQVRGIPVTSLDGSNDTAVVQTLTGKLKAGEKSIAFLIQGDYDSTVAGMTTSSPYQVASWLNAAEQQSGKNLDIGNTAFVTDKADSGMTIRVIYR